MSTKSIPRITSSSDTFPTVPTVQVEQKRYVPFFALLSNVFLPFLAVRFLLVLIQIITIYYVIPLINPKQPITPSNSLFRFPDMLYIGWNRFDSGYYLWIAHDGYSHPRSLHEMNNWGFFPLYPLLIHLFSLPFGNSYVTYHIIGILIANICALVAATYLYKLTMKEFNQTIAARAVFYLALFPMSFYLSAIYPESLFLALSIGSIYYARLRCWWLAGLLGGLASATRSSGVLLVIAIGYEYWQFLADKYAPMKEVTGLVPTIRAWFYSRFVGLWHALTSWRTWSGFAALALVPTGLFLFMLYAKWKIGSFAAYFVAQQYGWNHYTSNPILFVLHMLHHPQPPSPYNWDFYGLNIVVTLIFIALLVPMFRKLPVVYGLLTIVFLAMPLTTGKLDSVARYDLTIFPFYMLLAWWSSQGTQEQQIRRYGLLVASFAVLLSVGMVLFTIGVYAIA